jgi:hypothetical protein
MALLALQPITLAGLAPVFGAVAASDTVTPGTRQAPRYLYYKNASGGALTVTVVIPGSGPGAVAVPDVPVSVPAGQERIIGPILDEYADPATGLVTVTTSTQASITAAYLG